MENGSHFGVRLKWLGCACFELDFNGFTVVTDPWISDNRCTDLTWEAVEPPVQETAAPEETVSGPTAE